MGRGGTRSNSGRKLGSGMKTKVNWCIRKDIANKLRQVSEDNNIPMSNIVEQALIEYLGGKENDSNK